jgi:hypothetical protein
MKKLFVLLACAVSFTAFADPGGGYLGHRIMLNGEFAYAPTIKIGGFSVSDFYTKYDLQYGANLHVIVGRFSQIGISYNRYSLSHNQIFEKDFVSADRITGANYGITLRKFRKERGGLAPIGKFYDIGLNYSMNKFTASSANPLIIANEPGKLPESANFIIPQIAFGTQMIFWDHVVGNTGLRAGYPIQIGGVNGTQYSNFMRKRMTYKEVFSVFFGLGILI